MCNSSWYLPERVFQMNVIKNCGISAYSSNLGLIKQKSAEKVSPSFGMNTSDGTQKGSPVTLPVVMANMGIASNIGIINSKNPKCKIPATMPQSIKPMANVNVTVAGGDMTQIKADAYLVPQFTSCASEGGVGGAIIRRGAIDGMEEYNQYAKSLGNLDWGTVLLTKSGGGNSDYLLHAATAGASAEDSFEIAQKATYSALKRAQESGLKSVVIPAIGTGIIGCLTNTESANAILSGINQFAKEGGKMDVSVVVYSTGQGYKDFANALQLKSYEDSTPVKGTKAFNPGAWVAEMSETLSRPSLASQVKAK